MSVPMSDIAKTVEALLRSGARKATKYVCAGITVKATRRFKPRKNARTTDIVLTIGRPNAHERMIVKRHGAPKHVVLSHYHQ